MPLDQRAIAVAVLTLMACGVLIAAQSLGLPALAAPAKLIASCGFIAVALLSDARRSRYGRIILAGLVFSWFGDMFLLGDSEGLFLAGLVSFLVAHIAYILAFSTYGLSDRWCFAALLPVAVISMAVSIWLTPFVPDGMVVPVRLYTFAISLMVILAFGARGVGAPVLVPFGAALFYFSDLSVATLQFTSTAFPHYVWGLPFYYTGQLMLALSVSFVRKGDTEP
jgi:uncharacterized membrane protein YhhN